MSDDQDKPSNPVASGLVALFAVALAVGLVLAGVALIATRMLGLGGDDTTSADDSGQESLYLPKPQRTTGSGPQVTFATDDTEETETDSGQSEDSQETKATDKKSKKEEEKPISLSADQTAVGNFEQIDLSGTYPGGEGAILQVQRFEGGQWTDFDATIPVSNETFRTYVQSAQTGVNRFRVIDNETGEASNEIKVTVG